MKVDKPDPSGAQIESYSVSFEYRGRYIFLREQLDGSLLVSCEDRVIIEPQSATSFKLRVES